MTFPILTFFLLICRQNTKSLGSFAKPGTLHNLKSRQVQLFFLCNNCCPSRDQNSWCCNCCNWQLSHVLHVAGWLLLLASCCRYFSGFYYPISYADLVFGCLWAPPSQYLCICIFSFIFEGMQKSALVGLPLFLFFRQPVGTWVTGLDRLIDWATLVNVYGNVNGLVNGRKSVQCGEKRGIEKCLNWFIY